MAVEADFPFMRRDIAGLKELSVDIAAQFYGPSENDVGFELHTLVECKYRSPEKTLLLLEDPNEEFSPVTLGGTVASFDAFAPFHLPLNGFVAMEQELPYVYKGVEIFDGGAIEEEVRHGIQQLRFAAPALLRRMVDFDLYNGHLEERNGIFFTSILVTNAPLRLLNRSVNIQLVKSAAALDDISTPIDVAILYSDYGPDFEDHVRTIFRDDLDERMARARVVKKELSSAGKKFGFYSDPEKFVSELSHAGRSTCRHIGTQFFVANLHAVPKLLESIKTACLESYSARALLKRARTVRKRSRRATKILQSERCDLKLY